MVQTATAPGAMWSTHSSQTQCQTATVTDNSTASFSKIVIVIAIATFDWLLFRRARQQCPVPLCATIISLATPCAIAPRDEITHELVATSALPLQGSRVVALKHMLERKHSEEATIGGAIVAMELVIRILQGQKGLICCGAFPTVDPLTG